MALTTHAGDYLRRRLRLLDLLERFLPVDLRADLPELFFAEALAGMTSLSPTLMISLVRLLASRICSMVTPYLPAMALSVSPLVTVWVTGFWSFGVLYGVTEFFGFRELPEPAFRAAVRLSSRRSARLCRGRSG